MLKRSLSIPLFCIAVSAGATDYTATWWDPSESGEGYTLTQNGSFIFASFYLYGTDTKPTWYTGQLAADANGFSGQLYATSGPWFGSGPFDPGMVTRTQVGNVTFRPTAADAGVLSYHVGPTQIVKSVQRATLAPVAVAGSYIGGAAINDTGCANAVDNGPGELPAIFHVTQGASGQIQIVLDIFGAASCTFASAGNVAQSGQLLSFPTVATCSDGSRFAAVVSEFRATSLGIEGRWTSSNGGCHEEARFGGVLQF